MKKHTKYYTIVKKDLEQKNEHLDNSKCLLIH